MKRCILLLALFFCFQLTTTAQKTKSNKTSPKEDIHVNREFDSKGNLIQFDSVYSYSWSGDTILLDSIHQKKFNNPFGNHFNFSPDSSFFDNSFFGDFDQLFFDPFSKKRDSIFNHFDIQHHLRNFHFKNDTIGSKSMNIDNFFRQFNENNDSTLFKSPNQIPFHSQPKSMDEMMKMLQQKMKEMEEQQHKLFDKSPKTN